MMDQKRGASSHCLGQNIRYLLWLVKVLRCSMFPQSECNGAGSLPLHLSLGLEQREECLVRHLFFDSDIRNFRHLRLSAVRLLQNFQVQAEMLRA